MQVRVEDVTTVKKRLSVEVPAELVKARLEAAFQEVARTAQVKGFRPGKVPRSILERLYRDEVEGRVASELIEEAYPEALAETKLEPVARPTIENYDLKSGEDLKFNALVEVPPPIEIEGYTGLELEHPKLEVDEDMIEAQIEMLREGHSQMEDIDEPLSPGLWATADFEAFCEGKPVKALTTMGELLRLSKKKDRSEMEEVLVGMRRGEEREATFPMPENYHVASVRGKDVVFKVKVHSVKRKVLPPLDDEMARELKFESLAKIREQVIKELTAKVEATSKHDVREDLIGKLIELTDFELPESLVERELDHIVESLMQRLSHRGVDADKVNLERVRQDFRKNAERRARAELILARIAEKESIEVSEEDVEKGIQELAADLKEEPARVREFHERANLMESLKRHLREEKTMDFLVEHATLKAVSPSPGASEQ